MLFPVYWMVINSLETTREIFRISVAIVPTEITFAPYVTVWQTQLPHLATSLIVSIGTALFSLIIATPAAYALAHFRLRIIVLVVFLLLLKQYPCFAGHAVGLIQHDNRDGFIGILVRAHLQIAISRTPSNPYRSRTNKAAIVGKGPPFKQCKPSLSEYQQCYITLQETSLTLKAVGFGLLPVQESLKPGVTDVPAAT